MPDAEKLASDREQGRIPVTVLTGFLGSGKTTILARLLRHPRLQNTAVIVNEFGEVGLDHDLLEQSGEDMVLLSNGCVCCTVRGDLIEALEKLDVRRAAGGAACFDRVVIETTGLADPAPILHTLMSDPGVIAHYRLDQVIATFDAVNGMATLDRHPEAVKQAAVADRILLTKTDLAQRPAIDHLLARLAALNPAAPAIKVVNGDIEPAAFHGERDGERGFDPSEKTPQVQDWLRVEAYESDQGFAHGDRPHEHHHAHPAPADSDAHANHAHGDHAHAIDRNRHDDHIRAYSIIRDEPISWEGFCAWLEMIGRMRGDDLLRVKGIVNVREHPERPVVIHGVQHVFHPPVFLEQWPSADRRTRLVFITRDIDREDIDGTLQVFENRRPRRN